MGNSLDTQITMKLFEIAEDVSAIKRGMKDHLATHAAADALNTVGRQSRIAVMTAALSFVLGVVSIVLRLR